MRNNRKTWTKDNEAFLMTMARKGISFDVMSSALDRNRSSIYQRIKMIERREEANKSPRDRSEDLSDVIYNMSPKETPFASKVRSNEVEYDWLVDDINEPKRKVVKKAPEPVQNDWVMLLTGLVGGAFGAVIMHFIL